MQTNFTIFLSYSWADSEIVNKIDTDLSSMGLNIIRDIREAKDYQSIKQYMRRIRDEDFVLIIISDSFLKSYNCMFEILEFVKDVNYRHRIVPIILKSDYTNIFSTQAKIRYAQYWKTKYEEHTNMSEGIGLAGLSSIAIDARNILDIYNSIGDFLDVIQDIKSVSYEELGSTDYKSLLQKVGFEASDLPVKLFKILTIDRAEDQDIAMSQFLRSHPFYYLGYFILGGIEFERGNFKKALESYTQAINLNSKDAELFNDRGNTYYKLRDYDKAIKDYDKAIEINSHNANFYFGRGSAFDELGNFEKAINDYNSAIKLNSENDMFYNNRGSSFLKLEQFEHALKNFEKALELNPKNEFAQLNKLWLIENVNLLRKTK